MWRAESDQNRFQGALGQLAIGLRVVVGMCARAFVRETGLESDIVSSDFTHSHPHSPLVTHFQQNELTQRHKPQVSVID
jgi:hypothetical protein